MGLLDAPLFASRIREWLKTLRKKNVAVVFATQSLADIAESAIAPAIIESCPTRIFLPNPRALEPTQSEAYRRFGLNDTQIRLITDLPPSANTIPRSRHDPKILWVDDAEIVGDRITKVRPIPRNLFTQKTERRIGELGASCVALVVSDVSVHEAP